MDKFFAAVSNMFRVPDLRRRVLFTLGLLAVYRFGAHVTTPGIDQDQLKRVWDEVGSTLLGVLDLFSGGNFKTISVFALGVTPYITASIILQLLTVVLPSLERLQKEGAGDDTVQSWHRFWPCGLVVDDVGDHFALQDQRAGDLVLGPLDLVEQ